MDEIKLYIISNENNNNKDNEENKNELKIKTNNELEEVNYYEELKYTYKVWIKDLSQLMSSCSYRKVIGEIEKTKKKFISLPKEELFKYKILELKAIFNIIKKKLNKYSVEIQRDNSRQNRAIKFWFDQSFFIFEELNNDFDPEKNKNIKIYSLDVIKPIQKIIGKYLELIHLLISFYRQTNEIILICLYLSFAERFIPFIPYLIDFKSLYIFQQLLLFRAKICLENRDYLKSLEYHNIIFKLCMRIFLIIADVYEGLDNIDDDISQKSSFTEKIYNNFVNLLLCFYLKGVTFEHIGNIIKASKSYLFCKWIYIKFLLDDNELFGIFFSKIEKTVISHIQIVNDIREIYLKRKKFENKKIINIKIKKLKTTQLQRNINFFFNRRYSVILNQNQTYQNTHNKKPLLFRNDRNINKTEKLENYLDKIGEKLYKQEENRNNNLIKNFTKSSYIVSTMTMINHLLSKEFRNILFKMDKIEITKPKDEINSIINKTIIEKRRKLFNKKLSRNKRVNSSGNINKKVYGFSNISRKSFLLKDSNNNSIIKIKKMKYLKNKRKTYDSNTTISTNNCGSQKNLNNYKYNIKNNNKKRNSSINSSYKKLINLYKDNNLSVPCMNITNSLEKEGRIIKKKLKISTSEKVIRYPIDKNFSKIQLKKKNYLDKYFDKEIDFHKKLLNSKIFETKKISDIDLFKPKKAKEKAEREFDLIYNIEKTKFDNKNMSRILNLKKLRILNDFNKKNKKQDNEINELNMEIKSSRKKRQRRLGIVEINQKKLIWLNNEGKMKKLSAECEEISDRQRKVLSKKRKILLKISNKK